VVMNSYLLWNITPYGPFEVNWRFGGTCRLHLQGRKISRARNQHEWDSKQSSVSNGLHGVISQKVQLFKNIL
jgi:hypothetical protein